MSWRDLRIRTQIALPYIVLFAAAALAFAVFASRLAAGALSERIDRELARTSEVIARTDLASNRTVLRLVRTMISTEIVTFTADGTVIASTVPEAAAGLESRLASAEIAARLGAGAEPLRRTVVHADSSFTVVYRAVDGVERTVVALALDNGELERARREVAWPIAGMSLVVAAVAALLGLAIARSITSPIERLVGHTRALASGRLDRRAPPGSSAETTRLGRAVDSMASQLQALEARAVETEKLALAGQLAARIVHDVRTPLTSIKMHAQLLETRPPGGGGEAESLRSILVEIGRVERVLAGLLDLARPAEMDPRPSRLEEVVEGALAVVGGQLAHQKIEVVKEIASELPPLALDPGRLEMAILNLIQNAIEALPAGGTLWISTRRAGDAVAELVIRDSGEGFDRSLGDRLFDPFVSTKRDGVGLGLVNTRSIIGNHGGTVELRPVAAGGTEAIVRLPIPAAEEIDRWPKS